MRGRIAPKTVCLSLLLPFTLFAGCLGTEAATINEVAAIQAPSPAASPALHDPIRAVSIHAFWDEAFTGAGASCGASKPALCEPYLTDSANFTGGLEGQALGAIRGAPGPGPDYIGFEKNPFVFTGSIPGCGSGSLAFIVKGWFHPDEAGIRTYETISLVRGSTTTGLAGVVDVELVMDAHVGPDGFSKVPFGGTIWCY